MKTLANENFPRPAVEALRDRGHDILWARTEMPGIDDDAVLDRAQRENRLVLTMDRDFGELAFRWGLGRPEVDPKKRPQTHTDPHGF